MPIRGGLEKGKTILLCVLGGRQDGEKELLAIELGYRESTESWLEVLRDLRERGLKASLVATGDGALGLWAALDEVFPTTEHQRCWNHRGCSQRAGQAAPSASRVRHGGVCGGMAEAASRAGCELLRDRYVAELRAEGEGAAADTVLRDWEDFVTFHRYPKEQLGAPARPVPASATIR